MELTMGKKKKYSILKANDETFIKLEEFYLVYMM